MASNILANSLFQVTNSPFSEFVIIPHLSSILGECTTTFSFFLAADRAGEATDSPQDQDTETYNKDISKGSFECRTTFCFFLPSDWAGEAAEPPRDQDAGGGGWAAAETGEAVFGPGQQVDADAAAGVWEAEGGPDRTEGRGQEGSTGAAYQDEGHGTGRHERGLDQQGRRSNATGKSCLFCQGLTPRFQVRGPKNLGIKISGQKQDFWL